MKKISLILLAIAIAFVGCDLIDGTNVTNPDLTLDNAVAAANSAELWLAGVERRTALVMNSFLVTAELSTDNYVNRNTFYNQNVDDGIIRSIDTDIENTNFQFARLRNQANFGINSVIPDHDPGAAGTATEAELYFYLGYAYLLAAENMTSLPAEPEGVPQGPAVHFDLAISAFTQANSIAADPSYDLALARAHYGAGNKQQAVQFANAAISSGPADYVRYIEFDGIALLTSSTIQNAVYDRQTFNDLQPLPRLDFLDPKYGDLPGIQESPIPMLKMEEAHLIIAEAHLSDNNLNLAKEKMQDIIGLVDSRPTRAFNETEEGRIGNTMFPQRPNSSNFVVRADANSPFREGLVLDRNEATIVPTISGTSVTSDMVDALTDGTEALRTLYLLRQEIFFGEGRRMFDLGVRWPVSNVEALNNPNVSDADTQPVIPSYIPTPYFTMNEFDADFDTFEVTIAIDMNRVIAEQRGNRFN
jgi:tetratricopeptide (TPR) repeat protein